MTAEAIAVEEALADELRGVLEAAGYTGAALPAALDLPDVAGISAGDVAVYLRRLEGEGPLPVLARLFLAGLSVPADAADAALAPLGTARLEAAGLLERSPDGIRPAIGLLPYADLLIACDRLIGGRSDIVPGPNPAARTLWRLTIRRPVDSALDLGAGSGVQALSLAAHAREVVATDISERALGMLSLSARLNGIANIACRVGSWFEPIAGRRFDQIVCNPPFVISPVAGYVFRDSGMPVDSLCRMLVERAPDHLRDGGIAQIQCSWAHDPDGDWSAPLRAWVADTGCDALLLRYGSEDPLTYAAAWNREHLRASSVDDFEMNLDRWLGYYRDEGIGAIGLGSVVLRRRADGAAPRVHAVSAARPPTGPGGHHVLRLLDAASLTGEDDDALLSRRLRLVDGHRVDQRLRYDGDRYGRPRTVFRFPAGTGVEASVALDALPVMFECHGSRTLAELAHEAGVEAATAAEGARALLAHGFLVPAT